MNDNVIIEPTSILKVTAGIFVPLLGIAVCSALTMRDFDLPPAINVLATHHSETAYGTFVLQCVLHNPGPTSWVSASGFARVNNSLHLSGVPDFILQEDDSVTISIEFVEVRADARAPVVTECNPTRVSNRLIPR